MKTLFVLLFVLPCASLAFFSSSSNTKATIASRQLWSKNDWSAADDWTSLSSESHENAVADSDSIFNQDLARNAADEMYLEKESSDDQWITDTVEMIHHNGFYFEPSPDDPQLYDTATQEEEDALKMNFVDEMGKEISMLVHCNERPETMLINEGRALPPLTREERDDVSQLITEQKQPTPFFRKAISTMFQKHATTNDEGVKIMDAFAVASWMMQSLKNEGKVGPFDRRVLGAIANFGTHGTGYMTRSDFGNLYLSAVTSDETRMTRKPTSHYYPKTKKTPSSAGLQGVWRDIRNHGMLGPIEAERRQLEEKLKAEIQPLPQQSNDDIWDECEILEYQDSFQNSETISDSAVGASSGKSSHELVELAYDNRTPKYIRDGDFVFIDEQTCIGCTQCAQISPSSFLMLDNGRARAFSQRNGPDISQSVAACPVNCIMRVSFRELKEMEANRDKENWDDVDRRHLNHRKGNVPLYVAGMDSDANHRSSWYHYLKQKCHMSKACPQKGCYDCPHYDSPGENPYFKKQHQEAEHVRAQEFSDSLWRKTAEL